MASASPLPHLLSSIVVIQQDESDYFLVNLDRGDSVHVDRAEARIFECCRTCASIEAAAHDLAAELKQTEDEMLRRVVAAIERFRASGMCSDSAANAPPPPPPPTLTAA